MHLSDQVAYHITNWQPDAVFIDAGNGSGVIDRLRQLGHDVIEVPFGGKAANPVYMNKRTEIWDKMKLWIREGGQIPNHLRLKQDLATPKYWFKGDKMILESKDDIKARGLPSSDWGDALCLTFSYDVSVKNKARFQSKGKFVNSYDPLSDKHILES